MIFAVAESHLSYSDTSLPQRWIEVLVDCPGAQGLYTYSVPPDLPVQAGDVLSVPFGVQQVGAIAIRWIDQLHTRGISGRDIFGEQSSHPLEIPA
ncbi:hypothetical protein [Leptolyngbya sp. 7M]|uniref:primosomal protein N' family DNA-binding protein n=1 Tax=Leptolyngbya sp. 7M TaxID=2812896 RepID=UPI001B8D32BE|nr:hypothetical protein [Leptolyngbya sp. 7M]QYO63199.1 hypothetical protein JVX88_25095 [Leptolyngbya sp. 7M]